MDHAAKVPEEPKRTDAALLLKAQFYKAAKNQPTLIGAVPRVCDVEIIRVLDIVPSVTENSGL